MTVETKDLSSSNIKEMILVRCFFFNYTATTEIYPLSLHDALPILPGRVRRHAGDRDLLPRPRGRRSRDRKSTRLNSSHGSISYAVFCLKKNTPDRGVASVYVAGFYHGTPSSRLAT